MDVAANKESGATVLPITLMILERYGVVEFDNNGTAISPKKNRWNQKVTMRLLGFISMTMTLWKWRKT